MTDLFLLSRVQMRRIERYFPLSHGIARVDDRRIVSAIVFVIKNGLRWRDAPPDYGAHKTIYNRFVRWSRLGVFNKIFAELRNGSGIACDFRALSSAAPAFWPCFVTFSLFFSLIAGNLFCGDRFHRTASTTIQS